MSKSRIVATSIMLLGVVIAAAATVIPRMLPTKTFWTEEQAREQAAAASSLHRATHQSAHTDASKQATETDKLHAQQQLAAAQARFEASRETLERAQFWRQTLPSVARWVGGAIGLLGVFVYLSTNNE